MKTQPLSCVPQSGAANSTGHVVEIGFSVAGFGWDGAYEIEDSSVSFLKGATRRYLTVGAGNRAAAVATAIWRHAVKAHPFGDDMDGSTASIDGRTIASERRHSGRILECLVRALEEVLSS